jgi:hypothetical protein
MAPGRVVAVMATASQFSKIRARTHQSQAGVFENAEIAVLHEREPFSAAEKLL